MGIIHPYCRVRLQYEDVVILLALTQYEREACYMVVEEFVVAPPRRVTGEEVGIVVLADTCGGCWREVLIGVVHTESVLPIGIELKLLEGLLPATSAIALAEGTGLAYLIGCTAQLLNNAHITPMRIRRFLVEIVE